MVSSRSQLKARRFSSASGHTRCRCMCTSTSCRRPRYAPRGPCGSFWCLARDRARPPPRRRVRPQDQILVVCELVNLGATIDQLCLDHVRNIHLALVHYGIRSGFQGVVWTFSASHFHILSTSFSPLSYTSYIKQLKHYSN